MELPGLLGAGIKAQHTGWIETASPTMVPATTIGDARAATGEDQVYVDVPIPAVDTSKSVIQVRGAFGYASSALASDTAAYKARVQAISGTGGTGCAAHQITARFINSTTIRLSSDRPAVRDADVIAKIFACRWLVVEGK